MDKGLFLPIGTIVILQGGVKKIMIIARGIAAKGQEEMQYFEYGGCLYPEGLIGEQLLYFNQENIVKVVDEGYSDEDDLLMSQNIQEWIQMKNFRKGDPYEWNKESEVKIHE